MPLPVYGLDFTSHDTSGVNSEMASQTTGIQQLLAAEKKAADKVADARKRKYSLSVFLFNCYC